jgi:hypothetical protein
MQHTDDADVVERLSDLVQGLDDVRPVFAESGRLMLFGPMTATERRTS